VHGNRHGEKYHDGIFSQKSNIINGKIVSNTPSQLFLRHRAFAASSCTSSSLFTGKKCKRLFVQIPEMPLQTSFRISWAGPHSRGLLSCDAMTSAASGALHP
jgi:hypothetical protein